MSNNTYILEFYGCPIGRLTTCIKEYVIGFIFAEDQEKAKLLAYHKYEHIINVKCTLVDEPLGIEHYSMVIYPDNILEIIDCLKQHNKNIDVRT